MSDWITGILEASGYLGIMLLMFLENVFPPVPSELIMPFAGFVAAQGGLRLSLVILAGSAGSLAGALFWYLLGRKLGRDRLKQWAGKHGRWLTMTPGDVDAASDWFERHCGKAVFLGRMVPTVRTFVSVPAGISSMPLDRFVLLSSLGTAIWSAALAVAGYLLRDGFAEVERYTNPISTAVFVLIALWYLWRLVTFTRVPG